jgi:transposase
VGGKRLRAEVLLAVAASPPASLPPSLPSIDALGGLVRDLLPDPLLVEWVPEDLSRLLALLPRADRYLQDEVAVATWALHPWHPTLSRVWCARGRRGQRLVEAPGRNDKRYGFGLVDWREGWFDWREGWFDWSLAAGRCAAPFCAPLRRALARSARRDRSAIVLCDNLSIHTPRGSRLLRAVLAEANAEEERLVLVYTPAYDPEANRIEWLWRALRRTVTHCHTRERLDPLLADANAWATALTPTEVLAHIGSPCTPPTKAPTRMLRLPALTLAA